MKRLGLRSTPLVVVLLVGLAASTTVFAASLTVSPDQLTVLGGTVPTTEPPPADSVTVTLDAVADTFVLGNSAVNNGALQILETNPHVSGNPATPTGSHRLAFVRFDLSAIPATATIESAELSLRQVTGTTRTYAAQPVAAAWSETAMVWANRPDVTGAATSTTPAGGLALWAVTDDVVAFVATPADNFGWRLADTGTGNVTTTFRSREYGATDVEKADRPKLVITYVP